MKKLFKMFILATGLVLCFNAKSFADVDLSIWGGYGFAGTVSLAHDDLDLTGKQLGIKGHYSFTFFETFELGLGLFFQYSKINADTVVTRDPSFGGVYEDTFIRNSTRMNYGLDVTFFWVLPTMPISPYVRAIYSFKDHVTINKEMFGGNISGSDSNKIDGSGFGIGAGIEYELSQSIRLFGEFMYEFSKFSFPVVAGFDENFKINIFSVNIGLTFLIF